MSMIEDKYSTLTRPRRPWARGALVAALALFAGTAAGEPARNRILDRLQVDQRGSCALVRVAFTLPVRYVRHFPYDRGDEIRIKLDPISVSDLDRPALTMRESLRPDRKGRLPLYEVAYEGDMEGGPFLTLEFRRAVRFAIRQGPDFRSVIVSVSLDDAAPPGQSCPLNGTPER